MPRSEESRRTVRARPSTSSSLSNQPASVINGYEPTHIVADKKLPRSIVISTGSGSDHSGHIRAYHPHSEQSSRSASLRSPPSSAAPSFSSISSDTSWNQIEGDSIEPSESASHAQRDSIRRLPKEAPPQPVRQHSSRSTVVAHEDRRRRHESSRRHHHSSRRRSESRHTPSDESDSMRSHEGYAYEVPHAPPAGMYPGHYRTHGPPPGSTYTSPGLPPHLDSYGQQALVSMQPQDTFAHAHPNPFAPLPSAAAPFGAYGGVPGAPYHQPDPYAAHHAPRPVQQQRPQSYVGHYPGAEMMPFAPQMQYPAYAMPNAYASWNGYLNQPKEEKKEEKKDDKAPALYAEFEMIKALMQKQEENRLALEKERLAKAEAAAAAEAARRAIEIAEKLKKEEIAKASKDAKDAAEKKAADDAKKAKDEAEAAAKKAKEESDKAIAEAKKAHEESEKKKKALEEEIAKNKPDPDSAKLPVRFKDALGRKFNIPWSHAKSWKGTEGLIRQAFQHIPHISDEVQANRFDLTGGNGEVLLPAVWEFLIKPDMEVSMHMWSAPDPAPRDRLAEEAAMMHPDYLAMQNLMIDPYAAMGVKKPKKGKEAAAAVKKSSSSSSKKAKTMAIPDMGHGLSPPPPPMHHMMPPGALGPTGPIMPMPGAMPAGVEVVSPVSDMYASLLPVMVVPDAEKVKKSKSKSKKAPSGGLAWFAGGATRRKK